MTYFETLLSDKQKKVYNQVKYQVRNQVFDQVCNKVDFQVESQVRRQVNSQGAVFQVYNQAWFQINVDLL